MIVNLTGPQVRTIAHLQAEFVPIEDDWDVWIERDEHQKSRTIEVHLNSRTFIVAADGFFIEDDGRREQQRKRDERLLAFGVLPRQIAQQQGLHRDCVQFVTDPIDGRQYACHARREVRWPLR